MPVTAHWTFAGIGRSRRTWTQAVILNRNGMPIAEDLAMHILRSGSLMSHEIDVVLVEGGYFKVFAGCAVIGIVTKVHSVHRHQGIVTMPKPSTHVAMTRCFYCQEGKDILLAKSYQRGADGEMRAVAGEKLAEIDGAIIDAEPCSKCAELMQQGVIIITVNEKLSAPNWHSERPGALPNPFRSGGWFVVRDAAIERLLKDPALRDSVLKRRMMFMDHRAAWMMGLFDQHAQPTDAWHCAHCEHLWRTPKGETPKDCPLCHRPAAPLPKG